MKNKMTIAYAPDDKYLDQTIVSMTGAAINNPYISFVILYSNLNTESLLKLEKFKVKTKCTIRMVKVDPSEFDKFPMSGWVTKEAWFRVKLPDFCPDLDRILYLDCDTLVCRDLTELWETNLEGNFLGAVEDVWDVQKHIKRLGLRQPHYFNSGVLLFNCKYCRENKFFDLVKSYALSTERKIEFCDQDILNVVTDEKKVLLNPKYNYLNTWWRNFYYEYDGQAEEDYLNASKTPVIIHYTGIKPCLKGCGHPYRRASGIPGSDGIRPQKYGGFSGGGKGLYAVSDQCTGRYVPGAGNETAACETSRGTVQYGSKRLRTFPCHLRSDQRV